MSDIEIRNLTKEYRTGSGKITAVNDVSFTIEDGEFVCLVGPSGCGKTTLLRSIAGLETPTNGDISLNNESIIDVPPQRRELAFVFQDIALYPHMTAQQNIAYPLKLSGISKEERGEQVKEAAEILQIKDLLKKYPGELSGGQQQRVALGRSIVRSPRAFLLDEPMSDLDANLKKEMRVELQRIQKEIDGTMVYVTHDQEEAMTLSDRMVVLNQGKIQQFDEPQSVYHYPSNRFVAQFIGSPQINLFSATITKDSTIKIDETDWTIDLLQTDDTLPESVTFGFRPQHTTLTSPESGMIRGDLSLIEAIGDDAILYIDSTVGEIRVVTDLEEESLEEGETIGIQVNRGRQYIFDQSTGELLMKEEVEQSAASVDS